MKTKVAKSRIGVVLSRQRELMFDKYPYLLNRDWDVPLPACLYQLKCDLQTDCLNIGRRNHKIIVFKSMN